MGLDQIDRLRRIRQLLVAQDRPGAALARLVCFAGAGFSPEVHQHADADVVLVDLDRLYTAG